MIPAENRYLLTVLLLKWLRCWAGLVEELCGIVTFALWMPCLFDFVTGLEDKHAQRFYNKHGYFPMTYR